MNKRTLKALEGSIKKWEKIVDGTGYDRGGENCPLCKLFLHSGTFDCGGCPVYQKTRKMGCDGTPYLDFVRFRITPPSNVTTQGSITAAKHMLQFFRSLRPMVKP